MRLQNSFEVAAPVDAAWRLLNDVPAVLPCIPGAELVETVTEVASTLTRQFADCLAQKLSEDASAASTAGTAATNSAETAPPVPLSGLKLLLAAIWRSLRHPGAGQGGI